jgi:hypothetical protein
MERCRSYDATRAEAEKQASVPATTPPSGLETEVVFGTCGAVRAIQMHDSFSGWTQSFDGSGEIIGATRWSDANSFCSGTSYTIEDGVVPDGCR